MDWKKTLMICVFILLVGGAITTLIFSTEPTASRSGATQQTAMLVDVTQVEKGNFNPIIRAMGTVIPARDITLSPRVSGEIIERTEAFTPGGYVKKGEVLLQIDPSDYKNELQQRKSELSQAEADLSMEMGRQEAAQKEYDMLGDTLSEKNRALVLRQPQLNAVKSRVNAARAAVEQAKINLNRTTVRAPFDAHILNRNVNLGSSVAPGDNLGRLVGLDTYWVEASVPLSKVRWLSFPGEDQKDGTEVRIRNQTAWPEDQIRKGHLYKLVGALEDQTRMAQVLISVQDPHLFNSENSEEPAMIIGSFVEASIKAKELRNVIRLNRDFLRKNETVWVMEDKKLQIRDVNIVFRDSRYAYINEGLTEQDKVVTTNLSTVVEGARLRVESTQEPPEQDTTSQQIQ